MHDHNVAVVTLDIQGSPVNVIGESLMNELPPIVRQLEADPNVKAMVFISAKKVLATNLLCVLLFNVFCWLPPLGALLPASGQAW